LERPVVAGRGGRIAPGRHRLSMHVADGTTPRGVGLVESTYLLATTGRGKGRGNGRELGMTEDTRDHRLLGDDGNDPE